MSGITGQDRIESGLSFLKRLESDHPGKYWEVVDPGHGDHKIWPQTQYLLYVTFKMFNEFTLAQRIHDANDFTAPTIDRPGLLSNARFCVLDNDAQPFYLAKSQTSDYFDEMALIGHCQALVGQAQSAKALATHLYEHWTTVNGLRVLGMDKADTQDKLFRIYKTALAGTLFARVQMLQESKDAATTLQLLQETAGGWRTDLDMSGQKSGIANAETTCLALICLGWEQKGQI